ncbi:alpha/beta hydrolase fold domain-containing protein [Nocardioides sp.]|uniref:alpha/beta hydrolase fold domain-containing protein n=1 Tax=Nocardioides sp. TaxID=35761 RepID=UPI003514C4B8
MSQPVSVPAPSALQVVPALAAARGLGALALRARGGWGTRRRLVGIGTRAMPPVRGLRVARGDLGGVPAERYTPKDGAPARPEIGLWLHGGGFAVGDPGGHRGFVGRLALASGLEWHSADYRLAPEHPFPAPPQDALAAYRALVERGAPVVVGGDSAGASLALGVALDAAAAGLPAPAALVLVCPYLDLTDDGAAARGRAPREPLLTPRLMEEFRAAYAPDPASWATPEVSLLLTDDDALAGLPPILLDDAADDLLLTDSRRLAARLAALGDRTPQVDHVHYEGLWHDFHLFAGSAPFATRAVTRLADRLVRRLDG